MGFAQHHGKHRPADQAQCDGELTQKALQEAEAQDCQHDGDQCQQQLARITKIVRAGTTCEQEAGDLDQADADDHNHGADDQWREISQDADEQRDGQDIENAGQDDGTHGCLYVGALGNRDEQDGGSTAWQHDERQTDPDLADADGLQDRTQAAEDEDAGQQG